jgi:prepilin-type N-terminal cleavage/methylation domain-containing protein
VRRDAGFTLIELMVVVAIVAVLATIAIPSFFGESSKAKAEGEVAAMFAELRVRQEQYHLENGVYLSTSAAETTTWPTAPNRKGQTIQPLPATWQALKLLPPDQTAYCTYVAIAGVPGGAGGTIATSFGFAAPNANWFYLVARCNMDGNSATDGYFFTSSVDATIRKRNPSK